MRTRILAIRVPTRIAPGARIQADIATILEQRRTAGDDDNVHSLVLLTQTGPFGEDWHPTIMEQASMENRAIEMIRALLNW